MELTDAISTDEIKAKLQNLKEHMPGEPQFTYDFAAYLATKLNPKLAPMGFNITFQLTLYDLRKGIDGITKKPTPSSISMMPAPVYIVTEMNLPRIAQAVCPKDFAEQVEKMYKETRK